MMMDFGPTKCICTVQLWSKNFQTWLVIIFQSQLQLGCSLHYFSIFQHTWEKMRKVSSKTKAQGDGDMVASKASSFFGIHPQPCQVVLH